MNTRTPLVPAGVATLALWLLAAHLFRSHLLLLATVAALAPLLLLLRSRAAPLLVQAMLVLGALEWLRTIAQLTMARMAMSQPWLRMSLILLAVAAFTALAAWLLRQRWGARTAAT
jgi:hypothetical protein